MSTSTTRSQVILSGSKDWDEWLELIKTAALKAKVWPYINPSTSRDSLPVLTAPIRPTPTTVHQSNTTVLITDLTDDEKEELRALQAEYLLDRKQHERQEDALCDVHMCI